MQTSYKYLQDRAIAGKIEGMFPKRIATFNNPVDTMYFGQMAARVASDDNGCKLPATSGAVILGLVVRDPAQESHELVNSGLLASRPVPILHDGEAWMATEEAVVVGDTPYIVYAGKKQVQTITLSTDLIASNVMTTVVNGSSVASTYATSHAATLTAHALLISVLKGVTSATASGDVITVTSDLDVALVITSAVTLGSSQPTVVIAETVAALGSSTCGKLRNDADSSRALDGSSYLTILEYDSVTTLARVRVKVAA